MRRFISNFATTHNSADFIFLSFFLNLVERVFDVKGKIWGHKNPRLFL